MSTPTWKNPIIKWVDHRLPVFTFLDHSIITYPTPRNLNYWWNFGSLAGMILVIMIATGIVLARGWAGAPRPSDFTAGRRPGLPSIANALRDAVSCPSHVF